MTINRKQLLAEIALQRSRLFKLVYSWTHNHSLSEDLCQETIKHAIEKIATLKNPQALSLWLSRILSNKFRNFVRLSRDTEQIDELILQDNTTPELLYEQSRLRDKIRNAVASLPVGQRMAITLSDLQGHTYLEIADILDVPVGTVMSRLSRARRRMAELLDGEQVTSSNKLIPFR